MGGAFPGGSVSILRMHDAALFRNEKSLLFASVQWSLAAISQTDAAQQMRRLVDPCVGSARQDILAAAGMDAKLDGKDLSYESRVAFRKAKEERGNSPRKLGNGRKEANRDSGDGRAQSLFHV